MFHNNDYPIGAMWEGDQEMRASPVIVGAIDDRESGYFEKLGARTETCLELFFSKWGTYCAERPKMILFIGN